MQTIEIKGWIFAKTDEWSDDVEYVFSQHDYEKWAADGDTYSSSYAGYKRLAEHVITAEVPDGIDVTAIKIASLERERTALRAAFQLKLNEINERLSKLQAIEYTPAQEAA